MAATAIKDTTNQGYVLSFMLHAGIIALAWAGLPYMRRELPDTNPPLIVDLVPIEEVTSAPPPPSPEPAPTAPVAPPEPPKPVQAEAPASDVMPPPPQEQVPVKQEEAPQPKIKPVPKPPPPKPSKKDDVAMLQDLLKDMQKKAPPPKPSTQSANASPTNNIAPSISDRASMTELDAVRRHIEGCWRIDPGQEGVEKLAAEIKVAIDPTGKIFRVDIVDMARYFADDQFRRFANNVRISVLSCPPIPVSPERISVFNGMTLTFSPQGRIN